MLKIEGLSAGYGRKPVIRDIDAAFSGAQIISVIGPNGSGKSTLMKAVMGFCSVFSGTICLDGRPVKEVGSRAFAQRVSYLPQIRPAGSITAGRLVLHGRFPYLSYPRHYRKQDYAVCRSVMEEIGIWDLKDAQMEALSGGERQKVYLAMALAGDTDLLLLDEPATYLDVRYQAELSALMQKLKERGKTVAAVLHDMNSALRISDRVLVMREGRIVMEGTPEEVYAGGVLREVFGVEVRRFLDEDGTAYYFAAGPDRIV